MERNTQTQRKDQPTNTNKKTERGSQHVGQQDTAVSENANAGRNVDQPVRKGNSAPTQGDGSASKDPEMELQDTPTELADLGYGDGPVRTKVQPNQPNQPNQEDAA